MVDADHLERIFGYQFRERSLLDLALTHPSVIHEPGAAGSQDNQRLEFLGDAVLQLVLTETLYVRFAEAGEGALTKARAQLVNRRSLADQARRLELGRFLRLSRGEELNGGRERPSILADAYEALMGALFLDGGFAAAQRVISEQFGELMGQLELLPSQDNPKGELQELVQSRGPYSVHYRLESTTGPDHDRVFECAVWYRGVELGRGSGKSKKEAESNAAMAGLALLRSDEGSTIGPDGG